MILAFLVHGMGSLEATALYGSSYFWLNSKPLFWRVTSVVALKPCNKALPVDSPTIGEGHRFQRADNERPRVGG